MAGTTGMSRTTGAELTGLAHIAQSVADILTTPIGTRIMRRDYGSLIPDLIDQPMTAATLLRVYSAAVLALAKWEPRVRVESLTADPDENDVAAMRSGRLTLRMALVVLASGERSNVAVTL